MIKKAVAWTSTLQRQLFLPHINHQPLPRMVRRTPTIQPYATSAIAAITFYMQTTLLQSTVSSVESQSVQSRIVSPMEPDFLSSGIAMWL